MKQNSGSCVKLGSK